MAFATVHRVDWPSPINIEWVSANYRLPVAANLPVEVIFRDGKAEMRDTISGDWKDVISWRTVEKVSKKK